MKVEASKATRLKLRRFLSPFPVRYPETFTPVARIVEFGDDTAKFLPTSDATDEAGLRAFTQGVLDGTIEVKEAKRHHKGHQNDKFDLYLLYLFRSVITNRRLCPRIGTRCR